MTPDLSPPPPLAATVRRRADGPDSIEARLVRRDATPLYLGYVVHASGADDEEWRGHVGIDFLPVGVGTCVAMEGAMERRALAKSSMGDTDGRRGGASYGARG